MRTQGHVKIKIWSDDPEQVEETLDADDDAGYPFPPYHPDVHALPWLTRSFRLLISDVRCGASEDANKGEDYARSNEVSATD